MIQKFFHDELTQAEEQNLGEMIWNSEETAKLFQEEAEKVYLKYGLPEPKWPGGGPPKLPWKGSAWKLWSLVAVSLAGLGLVAAWTIVRHKTLPTAAALPAGPASLKVSPVKKMKPVSGDPEAMAPAMKTGEEEKPRSRPTLEAQLSHSLTQAVLTPVEISSQPHRTHPNLSVSVRRYDPGKVSVKVFNPEGVQVVLLYEGMLQAGNWAFDWDGKMADGRKPAPGTYEIQIISGPVTQVKDILLR